MSYFQRFQPVIEAAQVVAIACFRQHDAVRPSRNDCRNVFERIGVRHRVDAHPERQVARRTADIVRDVVPRLGPRLGCHGILQVEDHRVGAAGDRLVEALRPVTGHEQH